MVQEIDAAKKRVQQRKDFIEAERQRYQDSIIKTVWFVVETTPAYNTGGYYDQDIPEHNKKVSTDFDNREDAVKWMERHEADEGKVLRIGKSHLQKIEYKKWSPMTLERY